MGKNKIKKRVTIQKQFVTSYAIILILSLISAFAAYMIYYSAYHHIGGNDNVKIMNPNVREIIEYAQKYSDVISDRNYRDELDKLVKKNGMDYYFKDMENRILYTSVKTHAEEVSNPFVNSSMSIPLLNRNSGKIDRIFVLVQFDSMWFFNLIINLGIPFAFFIIFSLIFAGRISRRIKTSLNELMGAVGKIKGKDLDFTINYVENNEIGDLASAFEEMREELKNSLIREWKLEQDRREMVSSITHDMKTPLAIIQGHLEGLQEGMKNNGDKLDEYLHVIEQNTFRAKKLVDEMNELVEIDSIDFALNPRLVVLDEFFRCKTNELALLASKKDISIETEIFDNRESSKPVNIDCDRLAQIIDNLAGNSMRFTPQNGTIVLTAVIGVNRTDFKICDTGPGFGEKDLKNLFRKFYKGDMSRSIEKGHSGLGLYIAKTLVEKNGGGIKASNLAGGGACVEFYITY